MQIQFSENPFFSGIPYSTDLSPYLEKPPVLNEIDPHIKSEFENAVQRAQNLPHQPPDVLLE